MEAETSENVETQNTTENKRQETIVVVRGMGCLSEIISWIIALFLIPVVVYFLHNWQLKKETESRLESNTLVVGELMKVSDRIYNLTNLEIKETNSQPAKAFFVFYQKDPKGNIQTTFELEAYKLGGGVFKIFTPPIEISFGLKTAYWFHDHIIEPQLPEYNFLLATPYSLEFCVSLGNCKMLKKAVGFSDENGKFSYFF